MSFLGCDRLASVSWDGTLRVRDITGGKARQQVIEMGQGRNHCIACNDATGLALTAGDEGILRLWDLGSGDMVRQMTGHKQRVNSVALSVDARLAVSGGDDRTVRLWDVATGDMIEMWTEHAGWVSTVAFTDRCLRVLSAGWDGVARVRPLAHTTG